MKKVIIISFFVGLFLSGFSQEKKINERDLPAQVTDYLKKHYPDKKETEYYKKKENDTLFFEIEFKINKQEYNLKFSLNGALLETEREIEFDELEPSIQKSISLVLADNFKKSKIKKTQEVDPVGNKRYEINVKVKKHKENSIYKNSFYDLLFNKNGELLQIEEVKLESIESVF